jgi:hypothetical protein
MKKTLLLGLWMLLSIQSTPTIAATISLESLSRLKDSSGNDLNNGLVLVGSFLARPDTGGATAISTLFTGDLTTTRNNLTSGSYFTVFGEGSVLQGGVQFVGRDYTTTPVTSQKGSFVDFVRTDSVATSLENQSLFLLIFNQSTIATSSEMMIFRPYLDLDSGLRSSIPEGDVGSFTFCLEAPPTGLPPELFFGTWSDDGITDSDFLRGAFNTVAMNQVFGISSSSTASATNGSPFSYQIVANNGPISYAATGMPSGLQIDTATGLISGFPNDTAGRYPILLQSIGGTVTSSKTLTLTLSASAWSPPVIVTTTNLVNLFAGVSYTNAYTIVATNAATNPPITSYGASNLPSGLSVNTNTGVISGMPTQLVTNRIIPISAYNGATGAGQFTLTINSPTVTYPSLTFTAGSSSNSPVPTVTAGYSPTNFTASNLPTGLYINSSGVIQGTPTIGGTISTSTITAVDASGVASSVSQVITVNTLRPTINSAPVYTILNRTNATPYVITTTLTSTVVAPSAFSVSRGSLPTGMSLNTFSGVISGTPVSGKGVTVVGLRANNASANGSPVPGGGGGPEFDLTIQVDANTPIVGPEYTLYYRVGQHVNGYPDYPNQGVGFYLSGSIPPGITNKLPLGTGFSGTPSSSGSYTSAITYSESNLNGDILQAVQPVKIRVNRGTQAFYEMDGNLDGGPSGRTLTGQVAGYFTDRFDRPNSSVKVSTGSGLVHSNPHTEVVDQFSLSLWFKMPDTPIPAGGAYLIKGNPAVHAVSIKLIPSTTSSRVRLVLENVKSQNSNDGSGLFSGNQFTTPEIEGWSPSSGWHHIVFQTWGRREIVYLDGVGLSRLGYYYNYLNFAPTAFDLNNFSIGGNPWSTDTAPFSGEIDEVGVCDIPLEETDLSLFEFGRDRGLNPMKDPTVESLYLHGLPNAGGGKLSVYHSSFYGFSPHLETTFQGNRIVDLDTGMFTVSGLDSNGRPMLYGHISGFMYSPGDPSLGVPPPCIVSGVAELRSGAAWHLALNKDAKAYYLGFENYADLNLITPHQVSLKSSSAVAVAAGLNHAMILKADGSLDVWHPLTEPHYWFPFEPEATFLGQTSVPAAATHLVAIAAGSNHCVALDREGRVFAWGDNSNGQCDVPLAAQANIVKIAAGGDLSMALTRDGRVLFWGLHDLAVGSPDAFQGKYRFIDVGVIGSLGALTEDGRLVTWLRWNAELQNSWDANGLTKLLNSYIGFSGISRFKMGGWPIGDSGTELPVILQADNVPSWKMNFPLKLIGRPGVPFSFGLSSVADLPSGQTHRFEAIGLPSGVILDAGSGILSAPNGLPTQAQTVTFVVRNDNGLDRRSVSLQAEDPVGIQLLACNPQESQNTVLLATLRLPAGWQLSPISVVHPYVAREVYGGWEIWSRAGLDYENAQERIVNISVSATDPLGGAHSTNVEVALLNDPWEDADGDTVREYFEDLYGSSDQLADTDGDGVSDWQEIQAGTSPKNPAVRPGSGSAFGDNHNGKFRFQFHAGIGKWVTVQSSEDLVNWYSETFSEGESAELYPGFEGDGEIWEAEFPISSGKQFYRTLQTNFRPVSR